MTEAEWHACPEPSPMLEFLHGKASERKLRLFAVACCRRVWHLLWDDFGRPTVEVSEQFADGESSLTELERWGRKNTPFGPLDQVSQHLAQIAALQLGFGELDSNSARGICIELARAKGADGLGAILGSSDWPDSVGVDEQSTQSLLICDIFGNPFRPSPPLPAAVPAWNDGTVRRIAEGIYEERQLPAGTLSAARLAILADALLDAGCEDEDLIAHCRSDGPHVRGCWAVDLILGKS
jgi:hypothetical protein